MSLVFEWNDQWDEEDRRKVDALEFLALPWHGSLRGWLVDRERKMTFLCFAVGAWGGGGKYVLYIEDTPVKVSADCFGEESEVTRYVVNSVLVPNGLAAPKETVTEYLREAFYAYGHSYPVPVARVEVEFRPGAVL